MAQADTKNVMLIGRSRTGKSTIKMLLVDPTKIPEDMDLKSGTKEPLFQSYHIAEKQVILNIIDTPGLFERGIDADKLRDNKTILKTIKICVNREITKFHFICFCVSIISGINQQDIESLVLLTEYLGSELSRNSCLIITHCESKNDTQRDKMHKQLFEDSYFKAIASFFELGIFFTGSINWDDYNNGHKSIIGQFKTSISYRTTLIDLFGDNSVEPFQINAKLIKRLLEGSKEENAQRELEKTIEEQAKYIDELIQIYQKGEASVKPIIEKIRATNQRMITKSGVSGIQENNLPECNPS
ncbi:unnamed protein product [Rotaria socialis]|uniref:AIG1-type G domain-containing protein n=1 Tax=Rotaria socialis TaxID=392032 RepID=A0A821UEK9_9BILA|nr:unnamed protein product [Rotaria socialis]